MGSHVIEQLDLFESQPVAQDAVQLTAETTDAGIAVAVDAAGTVWMDTAFDAVLRCAARMEEFTSDDVLVELGVRRNDDGSADWSDAVIEDRNRSALGGAFRRAAHAGVIEHSGRVRRHSIFSQRHRSLVIWRSLGAARRSTNNVGDAWSA